MPAVVNAVNTAVVVNTVAVLAAVVCVRAGVVGSSLVVVAGRGTLYRGRHCRKTENTSTYCTVIAWKNIMSEL